MSLMTANTISNKYIKIHFQVKQFYYFPFYLPSQKGFTHKGKDLLHYAQIVSLKGDPICKNKSEANRNYVVPLCKADGNHDGWQVSTTFFWKRGRWHYLEKESFLGFIWFGNTGI